MRKTLWAVLILLSLSLVASAAPLCTAQSYAAYLAPGYTCSIGANTFSNFTFSAVASHSGAGSAQTPLTASQIQVSPTGVGFTFSGPFSVFNQFGTSDTITYDFVYTVTAAGPWLLDNELYSYGGSLPADGAITLTAEKILPSGGQEDVAQTLHALDSSAHAWFTQGYSSADVYLTLAITSNARATTTLNSFADAFSVPEPLSFVLLGSSLLGLGLLRRRMR